MLNRTALSVALLATAATPLIAHAQLVSNGNFALSAGPSCELSYNCPPNTGWSSPNGYNFIFTPGTATSSGAEGFDGPVSLWGAANGGANNSWDGNAPAALGGNFLAADGAYGVAAVTQTINGLTPGDHYLLSFYWAGAEQYTYNGASSEQWVVSLGGQSFSTDTVNIPSEGFSGWMTADFTYTASQASEVLSFLAVGGPGPGEPPFSLLTGVSLEDVPEPGSLAVVGAGLLGLLALRRQRRG